MAVKPPRQERSRQTLEDLLDAAEALLADRDFDQIPIGDVVTRAGSSVGSFYARFPTKEDLLDALIARYHRRAREELAAFLDRPEWDDRDLEQRARVVVERVIAICRRQRGLLRARVVRRIAPGMPLLPDESRRDRELVAGLHGLFAPVAGEIRHPDPDRAVAFALRLIDSLAAQAILFDEISASFGTLDDATLADELTRTVVSYLKGG